MVAEACGTAAAVTHAVQHLWPFWLRRREQHDGPTAGFVGLGMQMAGSRLGFGLGSPGTKHGAAGVTERCGDEPTQHEHPRHGKSLCNGHIFPEAQLLAAQIAVAAGGGFGQPVLTGLGGIGGFAGLQNGGIGAGCWAWRSVPVRTPSRVDADVADT